uniref:Uncharacterized protein n=1 Tax=Erythrolobus australicus TaxID=1077150 RepID=A0A7S1XJ86_9RHOD
MEAMGALMRTSKESFGQESDVNTAMNSGMHSPRDWVRLIRCESRAKLARDMLPSWELYHDGNLSAPSSTSAGKRKSTATEQPFRLRKCVRFAITAPSFSSPKASQTNITKEPAASNVCCGAPSSSDALCKVSSTCSSS